MKIRCIECSKVHMTEGWISINKPKNGINVCEVHLTCSCLNRMTVEHEHPAELCYKETKKITDTLGCDLIDTAGIETDYYHTREDVLNHYFDQPKYEKWNTSVENERYYSD